MIDLSERMEILDLYARQAHRIDGGDAQGWADTFTAAGSFESPTYNLTAVGRDALREFAATSNSSALARGEQFRHWTDQFVFEAAGPGRVHVQAYMLIIATTSEGSRIDRSLRIVDVLERVDGQWLVASRRVLRDG